MGTLRLGLGSSPLRTEHERLVRTALRRGDDPPEIPEGVHIEPGFSERALTIAREGWRARALHEHQSSCVFSRLLPQLIEAEASVEYKTVVLRAAMDEIRHASLCMQLVSYLGGTPELEATLATDPLPEHPGRSARERALRNVIFASCLRRESGTSTLAEERDLTQGPRHSMLANPTPPPICRLSYRRASTGPASPRPRTNQSPPMCWRSLPT